MNSKSRISSIRNASQLSSYVTDFPNFNLADLEIPPEIDFTLPTNLRLGHLAESIVSHLIKASFNYKVLHENVQIFDGKQTIGELDFIIQNLITQEIIHLELAYKFYLYDPSISSIEIENWIGPNRKDSLKEKLDKLHNRQFPLLHDSLTREILGTLDIESVSQALCFLVSLFIPYDYKESISSEYTKAIKGYYLNLDKLISLTDNNKRYYLPSKTEWGMELIENKNWSSLNDVKKDIQTSLVQQQGVLCWQKEGNSYTSFFVVWW
jgi:hypothetical protein